MTTTRLLAVAALAIFAAVSPSPDLRASDASSPKYVWKSVRIGGCGFVDGIVFSEAAKGLAYCRTDMGGAYRRDTEDGEWIPLLDWITYDDMNLMGVESIAADPSNPDRVYLACGTNSGPEASNGAIMRSSDRGKTFDMVRVPFQFGGNENGRGNGERMAVDPRCGDIILMGTRYDGLVRSDDRGATWRRVENFPDTMEKAPGGMSVMEQDGWLRWQGGSGVIRVIFDPRSAKTDRSDTIYAAISLRGLDSLFVSRDAGATWTAIPGQPVFDKMMPTDMDLGSDGVLYVSYGTASGPMPMTDGAVWRFDTKTLKWKDITPVRSGSLPVIDEHNVFGYCSVAVDPKRPGVVMAIPFWFVGGEDIFRSLDGGDTWKPVIRECGRFDYSKLPYSAVPIIHWLCDVEVDPFDGDHLIFTTGFGGMETFDLTKADKLGATKETGNLWQPMMTGIEESVPLDFFSPTEGPSLVTGIGDYGCFIHYDLDKSPAEGACSDPRFNNCTGLGFAWKKPSTYVRVGTAWKGKAANIAFSTDMGRTWISGANIDADSRNGSAAIAADGSTVVWTPECVRTPGDWLKIKKFYPPHVSTDGGRTWTPCAGLPNDIKVAADTVNPSRFYAFDPFTRMFYTSADGGRTFADERVSLPGAIVVRNRMRGDGRAGRDRVYPAPGREGDVWLALFDGLWHRKADGSFEHIANVDQIEAFGFGKAAPGADCPALFMSGIVNGVRGIYRSDDCGRNFVLINDAAHQWSSVLLITGDMRKYGRVYIGVHGRGALYGDVAGAPEAEK